MDLIVFIFIFIFLIILGCPIAFAMILSSLSFIFMSGYLQCMVIPQNMAGGLDSFPLLAIPLFLLAGNLMNELNITDRIFTFALKVMGHITGGLGHVNVLASMIFSGMSGSAIADAAGLGTIEIKAMEEAGYRKGFSAAVTAASSTIGPIIPPSIPFIVFATLSNVSIEKLFMGGIIPGIFLGVTMMGLIYFLAKTGREICPVTPKAPLKEILYSIKISFPCILAPFILIFGILSGIFTATEAGGITVIYAIFLGIIYNTISFSKIKISLEKTFLATSSVLFLIATGTVFAWLIGLLKIPEKIGDIIFNITQNKFLILAFINIFLLIQGCLMSATAGLIIVTPMLLAVANKISMDPIHLGVVIVLNLMIGLSTPPVGMVLFVVKEVAKISFEEMTKSILPFYIPLILTLFIITYFPQIVLLIPNLIK